MQLGPGYQAAEEGGLASGLYSKSRVDSHLGHTLLNGSSVGVISADGIGSLGNVFLWLRGGWFGH